MPRSNRSVISTPEYKKRAKNVSRKDGITMPDSFCFGKYSSPSNIQEGKHCIVEKEKLNKDGTQKTCSQCCHFSSLTTDDDWIFRCHSCDNIFCMECLETENVLPAGLKTKKQNRCNNDNDNNQLHPKRHLTKPRSFMKMSQQNNNNNNEEDTDEDEEEDEEEEEEEEDDSYDDYKSKNGHNKRKRKHINIKQDDIKPAIKKRKLNNNNADNDDDTYYLKLINRIKLKNQKVKRERDDYKKKLKDALLINKKICTMYMQLASSITQSTTTTIGNDLINDNNTSEHFGLIGYQNAMDNIENDDGEQMDDIDNDNDNLNDIINNNNMDNEDTDDDLDLTDITTNGNTNKPLRRPKSNVPLKKELIRAPVTTQNSNQIVDLTLDDSD